MSNLNHSFRGFLFVFCQVGILYTSFCLFFSSLYGFETDAEQLIRDLKTVDCIDFHLKHRYPVTYNHLLQGGYFNMPSALMGQEGEIGFGYSSVPPYENYNLRVQPFQFLELTGNYRVFCGIDDPVLSSYGFGDLSDKGANLKVALLRPESTNYLLPGIAFGFDDVIGTRAFRSRYIVATQVFPDYNCEVSLGYGARRIKGVFGGAQWMPFRTCYGSWLEGFALGVEWDATDYGNPEREPHPDGRSQNWPVNLGVKWRVKEYIDLSASFVRGEKFAFAISTWYNLGETKAFMPKIYDCLPYRSPRNHEPLGYHRPEDLLASELFFALKQQGFDLLGATLSYRECYGRILRLQIYNCKYWRECEVHHRLSCILSQLTPPDIDIIVAEIEGEGFPIQEYWFPTLLLLDYADRKVSDYELILLSPRQDVQWCKPIWERPIFENRRDIFNPMLKPKIHNFFGSAQGKFRFALGVKGGGSGYLPGNIFYELQLGWLFVSNIGSLGDRDRLNPSQLINVHTDYVNYLKERGVTLDKAYLQKNWNLGNGFFTRLSGGYYDMAYFGGTWEVLYYPAAAKFAIGLEASILKKRRVGSFMGLTDQIRKLNGFQPTYQYFLGYQYFLDLYYDFTDINMDAKVSVGQFLARDVGGRIEIGRYFPSGLRLYAWITYTNGKDYINGERYYDKGVGAEMPLDLFYPWSCKDRGGYAMSAWLRDVGYRQYNGRGLYDLIHENRRY